MLRRKLFPEDDQEPVNKKEKKDALDLSFEYCKKVSPEDVSVYFPYSSAVLPPFEDKVLKIQLDLNECLNTLNFVNGPVKYVYNPMNYAFGPNEVYIRKYCTYPKKILFIGMNPGPFGMCQTGVPFGDVQIVQDWLKVTGVVHKPLVECPKRPVLGFACRRREQSGTKFWNLLKKLCGTPEILFKNTFVYNYCPLAFLNQEGSNITPSELKGEEKKKLEEVCDKSFFEFVELLKPEIIIGIGKYAENKTHTLLKVRSPPLGNIKVLGLVHPSPRVKNNQNWTEKAEQFLLENNLMQYIVPHQDEPYQFYNTR